MDTTVSTKPIQPVSELPPQERLLTLGCRACRKVAKYKVGRLIVDPNYVRDPCIPSPKKLIPSLKKIDWANWVSFTGYFVCKACGSGGPWGIPAAGKLEIAFLMVEHLFRPETSGIFIGRATLFDGTSSRTGYESVKHIKKLIAAKPTDAFLWSRLGNTFVGADQPAMAAEAFAKAIELNPLDMESLHSLGSYYCDKGHYDEAAPYLHRILTNCRTGTWYRQELIEDLVVDTVDRLLEISYSTNQRIPFIPKPPTSDADVGNEIRKVEIRTFDLSKKSERLRLARQFMQVPEPKLQAIHKEWRDKPMAPGLLKASGEPSRLTSSRVGRNDPCPCGSGKKYKHCCYR